MLITNTHVNVSALSIQSSDPAHAAATGTVAFQKIILTLKSSKQEQSVGKRTSTICHGTLQLDIREL